MRIEIAPGFSCDNWNTLKPKLDINGDWASNPEGWNQAIKLVHSRIQTRFLDSVSLLETVTYAGFAILALDCLLIEALQTFRNGKNAKNSGESRKTCVAFLTASSNFRRHFSQALAGEFFTNVRNGLLHDGETRKGWLVKTNPKYALLDRQPGNFFIVNRRKFHAALVAEFETYLQDLGDPAKTTLRKNLLAAVEDLCKRSEP